MIDFAYVAIDFETATSELSSACAIGLAYGDVFGNLIDSDYSLIKPPGNVYSKRNTSIHNIGPRDTENSPQFDEVWRALTFKIGKAPLLAHNAGFDKNVLYKSLAHYDMSIPENEFMCTLKMSRHYPTMINSEGIHKLDYLMYCLGYGFEHHNALDDAKACLFLAKYIADTSQHDSINKLWNNLGSIHNSRKRIFPNEVPIRSTSHQTIDFPRDFEISTGIFYNSSIVFTGKFNTYENTFLNRDNVTKFAKSLGAQVSEKVKENTDYLVLGTQTNPQLIKNEELSAKHKKVLELQAKGYPIEVIDARDFIQMAFLTNDDLVI